MQQTYEHIEIYYLSARAGFVSDPVASLLPVDQLDVHVHEWGPGPPGRPVPGRRGRGARSCLSQPVPLAVIVLLRSTDYLNRPRSNMTFSSLNARFPICPIQEAFTYVLTEDVKSCSKFVKCSERVRPVYKMLFVSNKMHL